MKHTYTVILAILLVIALAVPAFAVDTYRPPEIDGVTYAPIEPLLVGGYKYAVIRKDSDGSIDLFISTSRLKLSGTNVTNLGVGDGKFYTYTNNSWVYDSSPNAIWVGNNGIAIIWANYGIDDSSITGAWTEECDGSSCPANDSNHDNICDDCGMPLTMSLRSTLLDYARSLAENKASDGYPYWAIFQVNDTYYVHISKSPMTSPNGDDLDGNGLMYNRVSQSADGVNGGSGWYNGFYESYDEFVEANHDISNFRPAPPLAMVIQGVAEEQLNQTIPELAQTITTILLCGVGCLALLILLYLLGKKSQIFHL